MRVFKTLTFHAVCFILSHEKWNELNKRVDGINNQQFGWKRTGKYLDYILNTWPEAHLVRGKLLKQANWPEQIKTLIRHCANKLKRVFREQFRRKCHVRKLITIISGCATKSDHLTDEYTALEWNFVTEWFVDGA